MKKITALGFLVVLAIPLLFSVSIIIKQKLLQYSVEKRFESEAIQTSTYLIEHVTWVKKGKEVIIAGRLFDVKSFKTDGKHIILTGFFDTKEDKLALHLKNFIHQKTETNSPLNQLAIKFLFLPICNLQSVNTLAACDQHTSVKFYTFSEKIPEAPCLSFSPPPKL